MNLISLSIQRPIAVIAVVFMILLFGYAALLRIPIQMAPDVRQPVIRVSTNWPGAAPAEVEREIINRQEEVLKGLEGLDEMESSARSGRAWINLEFNINQNMDRAMMLVGNRLNAITGMADEADEPQLRTRDTDDNPIAWIVLIRTEGNDRPMHSFGDFAEDVIQDRIERVNGIARVNVYGGALKEMEVVVDPEQMARYGLTVTEVVRILRAANSSLSAGDVEEGKRRYVVRTEGEFSNLDDVRRVVLRSITDPVTGSIARVTVGDIGKVNLVSKKPTASIRFNGQPAMVLNAVRETGANVIEVMQGVRATLESLNKNVLPAERLQLRLVYDETTYINSSIDLVQQNIFVGGSLAALMLLLFLTLPGEKQPPISVAKISPMDINEDGQVDILDAFTLASRIEHRTLEEKWDINGDGKVDQADVEEISAFAVKLGPEDKS